MAKDEGMSPASLKEATVSLKGRGSGVGAILFAPLGAQLTFLTSLKCVTIRHRTTGQSRPASLVVF